MKTFPIPPTGRIALPLLILFLLLGSMPPEGAPLTARGDHNYPPYEYNNEKGEPDGFNVDIIRAVAREMGLDIRVDLGIWGQVRTELETGKIDMLIGMFKTEERDKTLDFTIPFFIASYAVFIRKGSAIRSLEDTRNKTIVIVEGDLGHDYVVEQQLSKQLIITKELHKALSTLSAGEGDCVIASRLQGQMIIKEKKLKNLIPVGPPIIQRKYCIAVLEGRSDLLAQLNEGLSIVKGSGRYDEIYDKWFGVYTPTGLSYLEAGKYVAMVAGPMLLLLLLSFLWSRSLKRQVAWRTAELQETNRELARHRDNLEALVRERTRDLETTNQALVVAKDSAEAASRAKSDFLANMSHEIRTPMNAILGFSEILYGTERDPQKKGYLNTILSSGKSLLVLINDILDLSKVEAGKMKFRYGAVSIQRLFHEMETVFGLKLREKGLGLIVDIPADLPGALILDETRLRQILVNLVGNAVKFTETGHIRLKVAHRYPDDIHHSTLDFIFSVEDTGIGIPEEQLERIFSAFSQARGQKSTDFGGTGLGLAITRRLIENMNGTIQVASRPGEGTTFSILLRDVEVASMDLLQTKSPKGIDPASVRFDKSLVLIADDIDYNRSLLISYFKDHDLTLVEAENGREAIDLARKHRPRLIIMDMKMPVMDGYEAVEIIKQDTELKEIPVMAVTASAMTRDEEVIRSLCDAYLKKPVGRAELMTEVMRFLPHTRLKPAGDTTATGPSEAPLETLHLSPELRHALARLPITPTQLVEQMALDKIEAYSAQIRELATQYPCPPLLTWSDNLRQAVNGFHMDQIKGLLTHFEQTCLKKQGDSHT